MPVISKETAQRHLDMWLEAEAAVSTGQSYQIEQMVLTRASLKQIRKALLSGKRKWLKRKRRKGAGAETGSTTSLRMTCKEGGAHGEFP